MYLRRKIYIGANFEHNEIKGKIELTQRGEPLKIVLNKVTEITEDCGYWRKANCIHKWFVDNIQHGEDDCKQYFVEKKMLEELLDCCIKIKSDPTLAPELLPPIKGFFFGSTDYDESYWEDIDLTINIINEVLNDKIEYVGVDGEKKDCLRGEIYYQSSW